jgi:hypothetical protein
LPLNPPGFPGSSQRILQYNLADDLKRRLGRFQKISGLTEKIGVEVILPALGRNYTNAGLKQRTGKAFRALTVRGAYGNLFVVRDNNLEIGVTKAIWDDYLKYPIEGHRSTVIRVKRAGGRALKIVLPGGTMIFRRQVKGTKRHTGAAPSSYRITASDAVKIQALIAEEVLGGQ